MNKLSQTVALLSLMAALASCGKVVGAFVPPQTVTNPAGLEGKTLTSDSALQPAAVKGSVSYSTRGETFADIAYPKDVPFDIRPHALEFQAGFSEATLAGTCLLTAPATATVTLKSLKVEVSDASGKAMFSALPGTTFALTRQGTSATYAVSDTVASVKAGAADTDAFIRVLTQGGPNQASVTAEITADKDSLAGCTISFKVKNPKVILSDFS
ncbi:hypothetical protein K7W42_08425 [Deinococcus sp. HMF7604]|uniref:hypothetical protein n=1 Tax=Deinococcus betulae TaxID=2873312 RepID=UPI001CCAA684|nr:hypothetical protein [Deinococcus betulae]MBZ9750886.1 hypothetical protein [Deinococcus betulae]